MDTRIVPYEQSHLEEVVALSLRAWEPVFDSMRETLEPAVFSAFYPDWRQAQREAVIAAISATDHDIWIAVAGDRVVGFAVMVIRDEVLGEIHMLAVDPDYQRTGIGTRLTQLGVDRLRDAGASVAMVETGGDAGHAAARLTYERAGFRPFPVTRFFKKL